MRDLVMEVDNNNSDNASDKIKKTTLSPDVYSITHDLRAPLMSIKGLISLLKSDLTKEQFDEYIIFLEKSVARMDDSITRIVESSKNTKETSIRTQKIDFESTIAESLQSLRYMQEIDAVHITTSVEESQPFISEHERLLSIFSNMISNAVRYRDPAKNSFLHIDISFRNGKAILVFADNGIGIEEVFQHQIFNKLFRVHHDQRGSGLGLHIVQTNVEKLKGEINVQSVLGEGTVFTIEIENHIKNNLSINYD